MTATTLAHHWMVTYSLHIHFSIISSSTMHSTNKPVLNTDIPTKTQQFVSYPS